MKQFLCHRLHRLTEIIFLFSIFCILSSFSFAQTTFKKSFQIGVKDEVGYDVMETADKGFLIAGFNTVADSVWKTCLVKIDSLGNFQNKYDYGTSNDNGAYRFKQTADGGYILAGYNLDSVDQKYHIYALKVNSSFIMECEKQLPAILFDVTNWLVEPVADVIQDSNGDYVICGSDEVSMSEKYGYVAKLDSCDILWTKRYIDADTNYTFSFHSIKQTIDGGYVMTGYARKVIGQNNHVVLLKIASDGTQEWLQIFGDTANCQFANALLVASDGYVLAGKRYSDTCGKDGGTWQAMLMKTDLNGNFLWKNVYPYDGGFSAGFDDIFGVETAYNGGYFLGGYLGGSANNKEFAIIKTDDNGNKLWEKIYGYPSEDICFSFKKTSDSGIVMTGYNTYGVLWDLFVVKTKDAPPDSCNNAPIITCSADTVMLGDTTSFSINVQGGVPPYTYFWSGPGGFASLLPNPTFVYPDPRSYYYAVYVTDSNDCVSICENYTNVLNPCDTFPLIVNCFSDVVSVENVTTFTSTVQGGIPPYTYIWSGQGGMFLFDSTGTFAYSQSGIYYYQLRVYDSVGCWVVCEGYAWVDDTCTNSPMVTCSADTVFFTPTIVNPINVTPTHFTVAVQGGTPPYTYKWYGDDTFTDTIPNPEHTYQLNGTYYYTLVVRDSNNCIGTCDGYANVVEKCFFFGSPTVTCSADTVEVGDTTHFTSTVQGGAPPYWYWWAGDSGFFSLSPNPTFVYDSAGVYYYALAVLDSNDCSDTVCEGYAVVLKPNGINDVQMSRYTDVQIVPNPFSEFATLRITNWDELRITNWELKIYDVLGREGYQSAISNSQFSIHPNLPSGIYFYQLTSNQQPVARGKLVKR